MTAALPLCVVGGGSIGVRHASVAAKEDTVLLTAVVEPDRARRAELTALGLPAMADIGAVPPATRAAIVATPTPDHHASTLAALGRGWAVLVEKPIAATLADADRLIAAAEATDLPLLTGHHRRCHPFVAEARARLSGLGRLVAIEGLWALRKNDSYYDVPWRRVPGAGPILTNLSHEIDLLRCLAGEITEVTAFSSSAARGLQVEDTAALAFRFAGGALGSFLISDAGTSPWAFEAATGENPALAFSGEDALRLIGTRGAMALPSLTIWSGTEWRHPMAREPGPTLPRIDPIAAQMERFARVARGGEDNLLATGRDGRATLAATLATAYAALTGRQTSCTAVPPDFNGADTSPETQPQETPT